MSAPATALPQVDRSGFFDALAPGGRKALFVLALIGVLFLFGFPAFWLILTSLRPGWAVFYVHRGTDFTLGNYRRSASPADLNAFVAAFAEYSIAMYQTRLITYRNATLTITGSLENKPGDWPGATALGDPFIFQEHYADRSFEQLAQVFGPSFARAVFQLEPGAWRGPIESGYGWHLVWIDAITPGRIPPFEEIEADVKAAWLAEQRAEAKRKMFEAMRERYQVVLPPSMAGGGARGDGPVARTAR